MLYAYSFYKHDSYTEGGGSCYQFLHLQCFTIYYEGEGRAFLPSVRVKSLLPTDSRQSVAVLPVLGTIFLLGLPKNSAIGKIGSLEHFFFVGKRGTFPNGFHRFEE